MPDYGNPSYWDERYAADDSASFDWYQSYDALRPILTPYLRKDESFEIFVPGCGNSRKFQHPMFMARSRVFRRSRDSPVVCLLQR